MTFWVRTMYSIVSELKFLYGTCVCQHMHEAFEEGRQIALAKILGVFQVSMKSKPEVASDNPLGKDWTLDVIVMENVFYNRNMDRTYDLKGSRRSRFSSEAEENPSDKGAVYLDSNLRKHNLSAPPLLVDRASLEGKKPIFEVLLRNINLREYFLLSQG